MYNEIDKRAADFRQPDYATPPGAERKETMSNREIETKARRLKTLKNRQESLQQEIDQLEADLKAQMLRQNTDELIAGPFRILWKMVHSSRFDSRRFKAENGNLYQMYMVPADYRKFSIV